MLKELFAAAGIGVVCGIWINNYRLSGKLKRDFNFNQDTVDGWKIYKFPKINYTWKTNSPIIHEHDDNEYMIVKIPEKYRIKFIFYT